MEGGQGSERSRIEKGEKIAMGARTKAVVRTEMGKRVGSGVRTK